MELTFWWGKRDNKKQGDVSDGGKYTIKRPKKEAKEGRVCWGSGRGCYCIQPDHCPERSEEPSVQVSGERAFQVQGVTRLEWAGLGGQAEKKRGFKGCASHNYIVNLIDKHVNATWT